MTVAEIEGATVRTFRVPGVGRVRVEIGDVSWTDPAFGHSYPVHRVAINGVTVMEGADWGVPRHRAVDSMDAALDLLFWVANGSGDDEMDALPTVEGRDELDMWVRDRRELRDAVTAPGVYWRDGVEAWKAERGM